MNSQRLQADETASLPYEVEVDAITNFNQACERLSRDPANVLSILIGMFVVHAFGHAEIVLRAVPLGDRPDEPGVLSFDDVTRCYLNHGPIN